MKNLIILLDRFIDWCEPYLKTFHSFSWVVKWILRIAFAMYVIHLFLSFVASHPIFVWVMLASLLILFLIVIHKYNTDLPEDSYISSLMFWLIIAIVIVSSQFIWALFSLFGIIVLASLYGNFYNKIKHKDLPPTTNP